MPLVRAAHVPSSAQELTGFSGLEGKNLHYKPGPQGPMILSNVSTGFLGPGTLCAVMGASGSGKTTLLKVLCGRIRETSGEVLVNGVPRGGRSAAKRYWKRIAAFIPQEDVLPRSLTARQVMTFQAQLHGLKGVTAAEAVQRVMERLQLERCADTHIGDGHTMAGLSGGERKRTSIGLELLKKPQALLLDEPTSGLDGPMALDLTTMLRSLCCGETANHILAVCTIHQPSSRVFALFDRLLLMRRGEVVYAGPCSTVAAYFEGISLAYKVPEFTNPAEHILDIAQGDQAPPVMVEPLPSGIATVSPPPFEAALSSSPPTEAAYHCSFFQQFRILLHRTLTMRVRDPAQCRVRLILSVAVGLLLGLTYLGIKDVQSSLTDRQSVIFATLTFLTMNTMMTTAIIFPLEKAFIFREYHNGAYRLLAWYSANMTASLIMQACYTAVYCTILYYLVGLRPGFSHFLIYMGASQLMGSIGIVLGTVLGIALPAVHMVTAVVPPIIMPQLMFSGFMVRPDNIKWYFKVFYYLSFFQYSFQLLLVDQLRDFEFEFCHVGAEFCPLGPGVQYGDGWITQVMGYTVDDQSLAKCWIVLASMLVGFLILGYWVTKIKAASG